MWPSQILNKISWKRVGEFTDPGRIWHSSEISSLQLYRINAWNHIHNGHLVLPYLLHFNFQMHFLLSVKELSLLMNLFGYGKIKNLPNLPKTSKYLKAYTASSSEHRVPHFLISTLKLFQGVKGQCMLRTLINFKGGRWQFSLAGAPSSHKLDHVVRAFLMTIFVSWCCWEWYSQVWWDLAIQCAVTSLGHKTVSKKSDH